MAEIEALKVLIVAESYFGNTARVAEAIARGLESGGANVTIANVGDGAAPDGFDLLCLGAPTHNMGLPRPTFRQEAAGKGGTASSISVAEWLDALSDPLVCRVAVFATVTGKGIFSGSAAKAMEKRLRRRGAKVEAREEFLVSGREGPLVDGELARAEQWGVALGAGRR